MRMLRLLTAACTACVMLPTVASAEGNPVRGRQLFNQCAACHSVTGQNKVGPALNGVVGRRAGAVPAFSYSPAMAAAKIVWNDKTLDSYLAAPTTMLRGTRMTIGVARAPDRADIISYLRTLTRR
jgi:cytochrome c